jgi:aryl-alcohol dehydrogenase-like predicted oxidoreductase
MQTRQFGPFTVSHRPGLHEPEPCLWHAAVGEQGERVLLAALDSGVTLFDTAALYGFSANETLLGRVMKPHRSKFTLASKGGMAGVVGDDGVMRRVIDGRPEAIRRNCEDSLKRLQTDVIDLYYLHRWDKKVPIEDSVGAMSDLVRAGKVRAIGLSEVSAPTLRKAHAVHPISALQTEYSLWTRNPEIAVLEACREIGATFVAFSPVARGFLCDALQDVATLVPGRHPQAHAALFPGELPRQPETAGAVQAAGARSRLHARATGPGLAAAQGARTSFPSRARPVWSTSRKTWARRT